MALIVILGLVGLTGCDSKDQGIETSSNQESSIQDIQVEDTKETEQESILQTEPESITESETESEPESVQGENDIAQYVNLLGLSKEELISTLNEEPNTIDEGGLEFKETGIRVWLDQDTLVAQIFIMSDAIDLNGVKIGDTISKFKEVFGETVSDSNGDAHFKYEDIFLSINYDTQTEETFGVYILKNDF